MLADGVIYHEINFGQSAKRIHQIVDHEIALYAKVLDDVTQQVGPSFANVIAPIAHRDNEFAMATGYVMFLQFVSPDKAIRDACATASQKLTEFGIQYMLRKDVYMSVRAVFDNKSEMKALCHEDRRYIEKLIRQFEHNGMSLDIEKSKQLANATARICQLENEFYTNICENECQVLFTKDELDGVPNSFFDDRVQSADVYVVSAQHQDYSSIMNYAVSEPTRKKMFVANGTLCPENIQLLQETVKLRQVVATLLGYPSYADYALANQMAKSPQAVYEMEATLRDMLHKVADKEDKALKSEKRNHMEATGRPYTEFFDWDYGFYSNMITAAKHKINRQDIQGYFVTSEVVKSTLDLYQNMLGLKILKIDNPQGWHPDVQMYEVWEGDESKLVGHAYLDLYVRKGKYSGAAVWAVRPGFKRPNGTPVHPVSAMVANFARPTSTRPALMDHSDIKILLHELGHLFHNICSETKWSQFHGTACQETDYVEAPSQMMENWAWEPSFLRKFAKHYETGEPMSDEMLQNLISTRNDELGIGKLGQVFIGLFDMSIHSTVDGQCDVSKRYNSMFKDIAFSNCGDANVFKVASCEHLMSDYAGTMYAYLWAELIAADMFATRFKAEGIDSAKAGIDFRREILQPGGSREATVSLEKFLGRPPNSGAFLKTINL